MRWQRQRYGIYHIPILSFTDLVLGHFAWDGENFSHSAENVHFAIEGEGSVPVLRATLRDAEGNEENRDLNLAERISNENGRFEFSTVPSLLPS